MDLFKSVFADDIQSRYDPTPNPDSSATWSFGGLIKTLADKSETVMESYRKEFEEFGSGLKKETEIIRHVASRAVNDSLEIGATVAQEKLESVGQAIDDIGITVWKSTAKIIAHGKDSLLSPSDDDNNSDSASSSNNGRRLSTSDKSYSRFQMQIRSLRSDKSTYFMEPEDLEDFENWKLGFNLKEKKREIADLLSENPVIRDIFIDSDEVESKRYWSNYFYKLNRLMKAEEARAKMLNRAISGEEDEDLSWDIDEDDDNDENVNGEKEDTSEVKIDEEKAGSCKDSDLSVVSNPSIPEEEGWDAIEEIRSIDDTKGEDVENVNRVDLHKRLTVSEEEDDLSWDIDEEEDQPVKA